MIRKAAEVARVGAIAAVALVGGFAAIFATRVAILAFAHYFPDVFLSLTFGGPVVAAVAFWIRRVRRRRALADWFEQTDWTPVPATRAWPWEPLVAASKQVRVVRAWTGTAEMPGPESTDVPVGEPPPLGLPPLPYEPDVPEVAGHRFPVTVGELEWSDNALGGAVDRADGQGVFVVVRLPATAPPIAVRRPYSFLGDSPRLERTRMRLAFIRGEIPPWTARGDELFTFHQVDGVVRPADMTAAIDQAMRVIRLADLVPDTSEKPSEPSPATE